MQPTTADLYPSLSYVDPAAAIEWLCKAFGFEKRLIVPGPDGGVVHSELTFGNAVVMIGSERPEQGRKSPKSLGFSSQALSLYVADPDAHFARAKAAGAAIIQPLNDEDYGSRGYMARDPEGHQWCFATYRPGEHWS